jgi:hypothetical protein
MKRLLAAAFVGGVMLVSPWSAAAAPSAAPAISAQPDMALVEEATDVGTFTAAATGAPAPTVRWQVASDRNGPWVDLTGNATETSTTLSVTASASNLGDAYRAVFTNSAGSAISRPAKLVSRMDWMRDLGSDIANVPLNELTIPGMHDMGTYGITNDSGDSLDDQLPPCPLFICGSLYVSFARAQDPTKDAAEALTDGIRYFDLRICGHQNGEPDEPSNWGDFTQAPVACHGLEAGDLSDILSQTRAFVLAHPTEVVILDFNHEFQLNLDDLAQQIESAFALPGGGSLLIPPQTCDLEDPTPGECANHLTLGQIWSGHMGNVIVNFENDGAPGSTQLYPNDDTQMLGQSFGIQPETNLAFYAAFPALWGALDSVPATSHFCTVGGATTSCFGNDASPSIVLPAVLNTLSTRSSFSDWRHLFVQFLQTTPDGDYIANNLGGSLHDMAVGDGGSNAIIGPALFSCVTGVGDCFAQYRPENMNILAINFYNHTDLTTLHALTPTEVSDCYEDNGPCDLTTAEQNTISCFSSSDLPPVISCTYTDPLTFDFIDQVIRFNEYARTAPMVNLSTSLAPASTGWYNATTLGGVGKSLGFGVGASDYRYPTGLTALSCLDGSTPLAIAPTVPTSATTAGGAGSLSDGIHQVSCQAADGADQGFNQSGNTGAGPGSNATASFQIDTHPPTITYTGNVGTYGILVPVAITCTAADALSGVASTTCANASAPAWSLGAGQHTLSATAIDKAGNTGSGSTSFTVTVSAADLCTLTRQFVQGSTLYNGQSFFAKAVLTLLAGEDCAELGAIASERSLKQTLVSTYKQGVQSLARSGWLTSSQASVLTGLSGAL